jgi:flagellar protein FlbD
MIQLTRLSRIPLVLNSDLIEHIEITPDTVLTLINGHKIVVLESAAEVVDRIVAFRRSVTNCGLHAPFVRSCPEEEPGAREAS